MPLSAWSGVAPDAGLEIRVASKGDLGALVEAFGQRMLFTDRIGRTRQNAGELLVAWIGDTPVGNVYLWCEPLEEPELRQRFPGVPLLNHLEVAVEWQRRGVGTALVRACEAAARRRRHDLLLLGVALDNADARRLYNRLGFLDWGEGPIVSRWTEPDGAGGIRDASLTIDVMVRSLNAPAIEAWDPWRPAQVVRPLCDVDTAWHVAGGWALELWRQTRGLGPLRDHHDLEIATPRAKARPVMASLRDHGLDLYAVAAGAVWPLRGDLPKPPVWQVWAAEAGAYRVDVFLQPGDSRTWIFRRDERVRRPYAQAVARTREGIAFLRPECALLYKAARPRPKDEADFAAIEPDLDGAARDWLIEALTVAHPDHPWLAVLAGEGAEPSAPTG